MRTIINGFLIGGILLLLVLMAPLEWRQSSVVRALLLLAIYGIKPFILVLPFKPLLIGAVIFFPPVQAFFLTMVGLFLNMSVGYSLGRRMGLAGMPWVFKYQERLGRFNKSITSLCFFTRLAVFPMDPMHLFFGAMGVPFPKFVLLTYLGLLPKILLFLFLSGFFLHQ